MPMAWSKSRSRRRSLGLSRDRLAFSLKYARGVCRGSPFSATALLSPRRHPYRRVFSEPALNLQHTRKKARTQPMSEFPAGHAPLSSPAAPPGASPASPPLGLGPVLGTTLEAHLIAGTRGS